MNPFAGYIALIIGHTRKRAGAYGVYPISDYEYGFNTRFAELIKLHGESRGHHVEVFFRDEHGIEGAYAQAANYEPDIICELHFNAFNGEVYGTETLYCDENDDKKVKEKELAQYIHDEICLALNRDDRGNRGLKNIPFGRGERGYWNLNQVHGVPSILLEPFFGDNKDDAKLAIERKQELAEAVIEGFEKWKVFIAQQRGLINSGFLRDKRDLRDDRDTRDTLEKQSKKRKRKTKAVKKKVRKKASVKKK